MLLDQLAMTFAQCHDRASLERGLLCCLRDSGDEEFQPPLEIACFADSHESLVVLSAVSL